MTDLDPVDIPLTLADAAAPPVSVRRKKKEAERIVVEDAITILGLSRRIIQEMAQRGEIPGAAKFGRRWTFDVAKLRAMIADKEQETCQQSYERRRPVVTGAATRFGVVSASRAASSAGRFTQTIRRLRGKDSRLAQTER
jgi:ribosomal protein S14